MILNRNPSLFLFLAATAFLTLLSSCGGSRGLARQLSRLDLAFEVDAEGDYRVSVPLTGEDEGGEMIVGLGAHTIRLDESVRVREIWSVAARIPGDLPSELAENLMADSWASRKFGSWAIAGQTSDGRTVLVYLARIPDDASLKMLREAIEDAASSAAQLKRALSHLETGN